MAASNAVSVSDIPPPERVDRYDIPNEEWWKNPVVYAVEGQKFRFYAMRHVAAALHRAPGTIRRWERSGAIPLATYEKKGSSVQGNRRLYTRRQIQCMVDAANEVGMTPGVHPQSDQIVSFGALVASRWSQAGRLIDLDKVVYRRFDDEDDE